MKKMLFCLFVFSYCFLWVKCKDKIHDRSRSHIYPDTIIEYEIKHLNPHEKLDKHGNLSGDVEFQIGEEVHTIDMTIYRSTDGQIEFNLPSKWKIEDEDEELLSASIAGDHKNFFVLLVQKKSTHQVPLKEFLKMLILDVENDSTANNIISDNINIYEFEDRVGYLITGTSQESDSITYNIISFITEDDLNYIDFTLKYEKGMQDITMNRDIFKYVIGSFIVDGSKFFRYENNDTQTDRSVNIGVK